MSGLADSFKTNGKTDYSKIILAVVIIFLLLAIFYLLVIRRSEKRYTGRHRYETQGLSKETAFKLTERRGTAPTGRGMGKSKAGNGSSSGSYGSGSSGSSSPSSYSGSSSSSNPDSYFSNRTKTSGIDTRSKGIGVAANHERIEAQLDEMMQRIDSRPKIYKYPPNADKRTKEILDAERDGDYLDGLSNLEFGDLDEAEKLFNNVIKNANGNKFKELYAYGGLMDIYSRRGDKNKFKNAFAKYVEKAQELKDVYGPMADSMAATYKTFEQMKSIDPGEFRKALTKYNLENKTNITYDELQSVYGDLQSWYPSNIQMSQDYQKVYSGKR